MNTGISVNIQEFDSYLYKARGERGGGGGGEELIFCLKEVLSFLGFCEALSIPSFSFLFTYSGR
jgi:hypothetical protein